MLSPKQSAVATVVPGAPLSAVGVFRLGLAAMRARYRLDRPAGALLLTSAVLDPFVYAGVIYFVIAGVFERTGFDRYFFLLVGLISFRWTVTCVLDGANFVELRSRMREVSRHPTVLALLIIVSAPSAVMLLSVAATLIIAAVLQPAGWSLHSGPWLILVIGVHGVWNLVAVLAVSRIRAHRLFTSERVVMVVAGLMWLLSPTLYRFGDIPDAASLIFTTLNPVSHVLAGYYNALWFGSPVSADVLPVAGLVGIGVLVMLRRRLDAPPRSFQPLDLPLSAGEPLLVLVDPASADPDRAFSVPGGATRFGRWYGRLRGFTGRDLVRLVAIARGETDMPSLIERIRAASGLDRLFDDQISLYPDRTLAQIAFAAAVEGQDTALLLDGVLDGADRVFVGQAWHRLIDEAKNGRRVVVVSYDLLAVPATPEGEFVAITQNRIIRSGRLAMALTAFYDQVIRGGAFPDNDGG